MLNWVSTGAWDVLHIKYQNEMGCEPICRVIKKIIRTILMT